MIIIQYLQIYIGHIKIRRLIQKEKNMMWVTEPNGILMEWSGMRIVPHFMLMDMYMKDIPFQHSLKWRNLEKLNLLY